MRLALTILCLTTSLYCQWEDHMEAYVAKEWAAMPDSQKAVVWKAYEWGKERGFRELGAIYAVENRGLMRGVRREYNGGLSAGPGQNLVRYATIREHGRDFSRVQYERTKQTLQNDLGVSLNNSYAHIQLGLRKFDTRWEVVKFYNGINAPHEKYPARVFAWDRFLRKMELEKRITKE